MEILRNYLNFPLLHKPESAESNNKKMIAHESNEEERKSLAFSTDAGKLWKMLKHLLCRCSKIKPKSLGNRTNTSSSPSSSSSSSLFINDAPAWTVKIHNPWLSRKVVFISRTVWWIWCHGDSAFAVESWKEKLLINFTSAAHLPLDNHHKFQHRVYASCI